MAPRNSTTQATEDPREKRIHSVRVCPPLQLVFARHHTRSTDLEFPVSLRSVFPCALLLLGTPYTHTSEGVRQRPAYHRVPPLGAIGSRGHQPHASEQRLLAGTGKLAPLWLRWDGGGYHSR